LVLAVSLASLTIGFSASTVYPKNKLEEACGQLINRWKRSEEKPRAVINHKHAKGLFPFNIYFYYACGWYLVSSSTVGNESWLWFFGAGLENESMKVKVKKNP